MSARPKKIVQLLYHPAAAWVALIIGCLLSLIISKAYILSVENNFKQRFGAQSDRLAGETHEKIQSVASKLRWIANAYPAFDGQPNAAWQTYLDSVFNASADTITVGFQFATTRSGLLQEFEYSANPVVHNWLQHSPSAIWDEAIRQNRLIVSPPFALIAERSRIVDQAFAMLAPVLNTHRKPAGWLLIIISGRELIQHAAPSDGTMFDMQLYLGDNPSEQSLLFDTNLSASQARRRGSDDFYTASRPLIIEGHVWTLEMYSRAKVGSNFPQLLIGANLLVHLLLVVAIFGILYTHKYARLKGERTAAQLRQSKQGLEQTIKYRTAQLQEKVHEAEQLVTELTDMNEELRQFAYVASHDLQEPLRMVVSFTDLLQQNYGLQLDDTAKEFMKISADNAQRMQTMLEDLLDYTRLENNTERYTYVQCEVELESILFDFGLERETDAIEIVHEGLPVIVCNRTRFVILLKNLIGNALRYRQTDCKTRIEVQTQRDESCWLFSVRDNGIGIAEQYFDRIFQPFKRLHAHHEYAGTGLGLAISRKVVESWGGKLWVESEVGVGSTFYFTVPLNLSPADHLNDATAKSGSLRSLHAA